MKYYFDSYLIKDNETLFYIYIGLIVLMIIITFVMGYKEIKKK